jgi:TonB-linked SusC/RagA family outer membrane protein
MKKLLQSLFILLLVASTALAQDRTVTGTVTAKEDGLPLPGVSVKVKGTTTGTQTGTDGKFSLKVNAAGKSLQITSIGYNSQEIAIPASNSVKVVLTLDSKMLSEVVVTGVSEGISRKKLGFALTKIDSAAINIVPSLDASQSLRGKVAGIQITQSQGDRGASVFLRGAKSVFGNVSPLIVVDGFVTGLSLSDLNPQDIASIEVVRGAAASALYGTRGEGGVIQVITKNGKDAFGKLKVTVDNEYGINDVQLTPELATLHPFKVNPDGSFLLTGAAATTRTLDQDATTGVITLHPYQKYYNNTAALLNNRPYYTNFVSASTAFDKFNVYASFQNQFKGGVTEVINANTRKSGKFIFGYRPNDKLEASVDVQFYNESRPSDELSRDDQGSFFAATLQYEPFINLLEKDAAGNYLTYPTGSNIQGANLDNPVYNWTQRKYTNNDDNLIIGGKLKYKFLPGLTAEVVGSVQKNGYNSTNFYPKGYQTRTPNVTFNNGYISEYDYALVTRNLQTQLNYNKTFKDFTFGASAKFVYEYSNSESNTATGYDLTVSIPSLGVTNSANRSMSSTWSQTINYGYFLNLRGSYKDKFFIDALGRIDESSRYGADQRTAFFPRVSAAYRITEDFKLGPITELKARVAYGQAGSLPPFGAKDSRVSVSASGGVSFTQIQNTNLERAVTEELEVGFDGAILDKINFQLTYAKANSKNDFITPPSFSPTLGSGSIYQNLGAVTSESYELELNGNVAEKKNFVWNTGITFSRVRSEITDLGPFPDFTSGRFRKATGVSPFAFWGQKVLTKLSELQLDANGKVINAGTNLTIADFTINKLGYVVEKSKLGTIDEKAVKYKNALTGDYTIIGDGQADFLVGFSNTFTIAKNLTIYTLVDWKQGGMKYNNTEQYLTFDRRTAVWQEYVQSGVQGNFMADVYNTNNTTNFWLQNSGYVMLREASISYALSGSKLGNFGKTFKSARFAIIGRNLLTSTKYRGSSLEGTEEYYPYPLYRTVSGKLTFDF